MREHNPESRVIILDDDEQYLRMIQTVCTDEGYNTLALSDAFEFLKGEYTKDDLIILDLSLPGIDGIEILRELSYKNCASRLIFVSGQDRGVLRAAEDLAKARALNYVATLSKPVRISRLRGYLSIEQEHDASTFRKPASQEWSPVKDELEYAINNDQIKAYYQPQVCLFNNALYGLEALARWEHPEHGLIPPSKFIPLAEETGLIVPMTNRMIKKCVSEVSEFSKKSENVINLSVNISAAHIQEYALSDLVEILASEDLMSPELFTLEVTESGLMTELVSSLDILARLRLKGFNLSIDDFGTGYSSLFQLHKMPFNELKVDQAFVKTMLKDQDSLSIVETCILLAKKLGTLTIAEGVEDLDTYIALTQMGCDYAQGYFIAKPMPVEDLADWYAYWLKSGSGFGGEKRYG